MRPSSLFQCLGCVVVAKANEVSSRHDFNVCRLPHIPVSDWENSICGGNATIGGSANATSRHHAKLSPWTHSSPCHDSGSGEYCLYSSSNFAGGRGISIFTNAQKAAYLLQTPAFRETRVEEHVNQDINQTTRRRYKSVNIPGKGVGLVATEPLQLGDHIMSVTASLMLDYEVFEAIPVDELRRLQAHAVDVLPPDHREKFLQLSTHSRVESQIEKVDKILATNAFDVEIDDEKGASFHVVFNEISRHNHDCRPNADYHWDPETLTQHIHAVRPIAAGEEITLSYIDSVQSRHARLARLHRTWGFGCGCSTCTQNAYQTTASDARIAQILAIQATLEDYSPSNVHTSPQMAELLVSLYAQERLDHVLYEPYSLAAIEWNGIGDKWTATKYARLSLQHGLASVGPAHSVVLDMESLAAEPEKHWSWTVRLP